MINPAVTNSFAGVGLSYDASLRLIGKRQLEESPAALKYELLEALYSDNNLYDTVAQSLVSQGIWLQSLKPLANPTFEVVEFYAGHLMSDLDLAQHLQPESDEILEPLQDIWRWSNWDAAKIRLSRQCPMLGDAFILAHWPQDSKQVRIELIDPATVTSFDTDSRGYVTWIRIDVPHARSEQRGSNGSVDDFHHVEVYDKWAQTYRRWEIDPNRMALIDTDLDKLGAPIEMITFEQLGVDFVPIVHIPFRDVGADRGQAAVWPSISKLVELDTIVTALHENYFAYDRPTWAIESMGMDSSGRMRPPPTDAIATTNASGARTISIGKDKLWELPAGWTLKSTVPDIQFAAGITMIDKYWGTLERRMPELLYSRIAELGGGNLSGKAVRFMLSGAIKRAEEARFNLEQGLVRAHMMALTIGKNTGVFSLNGTFDDDSFRHTFKPRAIISDGELERAQTDLAEAQGAQAWQTAGLPLSEILKRKGYTDEQISDILTMQADSIEQEPRGGEVEQ